VTIAVGIGADLDHVAIAAADTAPGLRFLTGVLSGTVLSGGHAVGFRPMQVLIGDITGGMKVELLEPWETERNDFLARFVAHTGAGPHHLTFKVADLDVALDAARAAGFTPIGIERSDPRWQETFLHPKEAFGTVVQMAQTNEGIDRAGWLAYVAANGASGEPVWWTDPESPVNGPDSVTYLRRVVLGAPQPAALLPLYQGLLGGTLIERTGDGDATTAAELVWPGGGCVRIEQRDDRPAGVDRLEVEGLGAATNVLGTWFTPTNR
jgi:catechol 2,3-dioxygenase-like lactoylglutathione lyase family enzyme